MALTLTQLQRYSRHLLLPEIRQEGQQKLKNSRVLVVGAGGLGVPVLQYLTAAGVGTIGIVDFDTIDLSNLQRQVLYNEAEVGFSKSKTAAQKLARLNSDIQLIPYHLSLTSSNALDLIREYDLVVDGTDNFPTRYLVNDACVLLDKPLVYGSIFRFEGQVSVFNHKGGPNYRDLFPVPPPPELVPNCAEGGVLGVLPGIIGSMQASEAIKIITGIGETLSGRLFLYDSLTFTTRTITIPLSDQRPLISGLIDYEQFCGVKNTDDAVPELSVHELYQWKKEGRKFQLIDVREETEYLISHLGGILIPKGQIRERMHEIDPAYDTVIYCRSGKRSLVVVRTLIQAGHKHVRNLKGGIVEWAREIDPLLPV